MANETLTGAFSDIADAIRAKGVTGTMTPLQMPQKIADIPSGGETPEAEWKDVNFIDYDGKNLYSYTTAEALALTELPPAPDRTSKGLTFQEWNYTLEEVKANANDTGKCTAGATYTTTDGNTHIKLRIQDEAYSNISFPLYRDRGGNGTLHIDWGDGTYDDYPFSNFASITATHQFTSYPGSYDVTISNTYAGAWQFNGPIISQGSSNSKTNPAAAKGAIVEEVHFGSDFSIIGINSPFTFCTSLKKVTVPTNTKVSSNSFANCYSLYGFVVPRTQSEQVYFNTCPSIKRISYPNNYAPQAQINYTIDEIYCPSGATKYPDNRKCYALARVKLSSGITSVENFAANENFGLMIFDCSACTQVPTLGGIYAFDNTNANLKIIVPDELYDDWITATNWSKYASKIVKASEA